VTYVVSVPQQILTVLLTKVMLLFQSNQQHQKNLNNAKKQKTLAQLRQFTDNTKI